MRILVAGGARVDAGKTTFSVGLVDRLGAIGFKPRAGNDHWFHHDDYRHAIANGRLYGKDARRLAAASAADVDPEAINPVHRFWRPAPGGDAFVGSGDRSFVLDRVGGPGDPSFVVSGHADVPTSARDALSLDDATVVETVEELNRVTSKRYLPVLDALRDRVERTDQAVVESYGDVARPLRAFTPDRVAVIQPGRARVYEGQRFADGCEVVTGSPIDGQLEERVDDVVDLLDPVATVDLPALPAEVRSDPRRIAHAYVDAYDALLDR